MQRRLALALMMLGAGLLIVALAGSTVRAVLRMNIPAGAATEERLPDLDQEVPSELAVRVGPAKGPHGYELGFRSAVVNVGSGPLVLNGARRDRLTDEMVVNQLIQRVDAPPRVVRAVGRMRYV